MNKPFAIGLIIILSSFTQPDEFIIKPSRDYTISTQQILANFQTQGLITENVFIPLENHFWDLGRITSKLNECFLYDSKKQRFLFYEGIKCVYNTGLINNTDLPTTKRSQDSSHFNSIMACVEPISPTQLSGNKYFAIIVLNHALGVKQEDNYILWETALKHKYADSIAIIKIQYDNHEKYTNTNGIKEGMNQVYDYYIQH